MSAFTKPPNDASAPPQPEQPAAAKPAPKPNAPPVVVTRTIEVGPNYRPKTATSPSIQGGPAAPPAGAAPAAAAKTSPGVATNVAPGGLPKTPTLRFDAPAPTVPAPKGPPPSTRPAAPAMGDPDATVQTSSIADTFERLLASDIDSGFDQIEHKTGPGGEGRHTADLTEVRALFEQLAASYVRPVRDFLMDLRWGEAAADWIDVCEPALRSLRRAAEKLELSELCNALDGLSATLAAAKASPSRVIDGDRRAAILTSHDRLSAIMPQAFSLELDRSKRESVILQSVLLQVPEVKKVTIDKLYAAGVTSLEAMLLASPADLVATTGIEDELARRIVARFRDYKAQVRAAVPDATRAQERERVGLLTARLKEKHAGYERAASAWSADAAARKKELRAERDRTLLEIQVVLARLGEVERLAEIERLPFERKLANLEAFLEEARDKYVAQP